MCTAFPYCYAPSPRDRASKGSGYRRKPGLVPFSGSGSVSVRLTGDGGKGGHPMAELGHVRLMIVDDHAVLRRGVVASLSDFEDIEVVAEAGSGEDALVLCQ